MLTICKDFGIQRTKKKRKEAPLAVLFRAKDSRGFCGVIMLIEYSKKARMCTQKAGIDLF